MKIVDILKERAKGFAFEFFPPKTEASRAALLLALRALKRYQPLYASMTYGAAGATQERTAEAVNMLLAEKDLVVMPHLTCIGAKQDTVKNILDGYRKNGIENIMALRGDPPKDASNSDFSQRDFRYAKDLISLIRGYGHFCIGVAVYPEGHIETSSLDEDLEYAKQKIDAGADFAVSQMFFDNRHYYALLERMKKRGVNVPVLPGILPLTDIEKVKQFTSICRTTIPKSIQAKLTRLNKNPLDMEKAGIDFTIEQCRKLIKNGIRHLHFFTLNKLEIITKILAAIEL
jgi:methylenetetrahydrofolate reductase (NADPH)